MKIFEEDFEPPVMCSYIDNICPFKDVFCDDCKICIAIEEVSILRAFLHSLNAPSHSTILSP
jgi:hypothetical protein